MKIYKLMASLALITLGMALILSSLHVTQAAGAQVVSYGSDKDTYNRGDSAKGYIDIKNTGTDTIKDVTVSASVARAVPILGTVSLGSKDFTIGGLNIPPGDTRRAEFAVSIPTEVSGISTAGSYDLRGNVLVGGNQIGSFSKHITVV